MKIHVTSEQIAPGHTFVAGDQINLELFGQSVTFNITTSNFSGLEFEITPTETIKGVFVADDKVDLGGSNDVCPDCKGKGVIELFNSVERCDCQNEQ